MNNIGNIRYTGPIYLGSQHVEGQVVYALDAKWLSITTPNCKGCGNSTVYNPDDSTSARDDSEGRNIKVRFLNKSFANRKDQSVFLEMSTQIECAFIINSTAWRAISF